MIAGPPIAQIVHLERITERLAAAEVSRSVGTVGDAYDNAWPSP
jgi:hypothetical protein